MTNTNTEERLQTYLPGFNSRLVINKVAQHLLCVHCGGIALSAIKDEKNHCFCHQCFYKNDQYCPIEKKKVDINDANEEREIIKKLRVRCENKEKGCNWEGLYKAYSAHIYSKCLKVMVKCKHEGCNFETEKENLRIHMANCKFRLFLCECNAEIKVKQKEKHFKVCPNRTIDCPNGCGMKIKRFKLQAHLIECNGTGPKEPVKENLLPTNEVSSIPTEGDIVCPLERFGCKQKHNKEYIDNIDEFRKEHSKYLHAIVHYFIEEEEKEEKKKKEIEKENESTKLDSSRSKSQHNKENKSSIKDDKVLGKKRVGSSKIDDEEIKDVTPLQNVPLKEEKTSITKVEPLASIEKHLTELNTDKKKTQTPSINAYSFDITDIPIGIEIKGCLATFTPSPLSRDKRIFLLGINDIILAGKKLYKWRVYVHNFNGWFGFGLCDKAEVKRNKCVFSSKNALPAYYITTENLTYSLLKKENKRHSLLKPIAKGGEFLLEYNTCSNHLAICYRGESMIINKVKPTISKSNLLTPCLIFSDAAEAELNYFG